MATTPKHGKWLESYFAEHSHIANEERYVSAACTLLAKVAVNIEREYAIPCGRVDGGHVQRKGSGQVKK